MNHARSEVHHSPGRYQRTRLDRSIRELITSREVLDSVIAAAADPGAPRSN